MLVGLAIALVPALDAYASVSSPDAAPGGFGKLVFRVPNESDSANTTALTVTLPTDTHRSSDTRRCLLYRYRTRAANRWRAPR